MSSENSSLLALCTLAVDAHPAPDPQWVSVSVIAVSVQSRLSLEPLILAITPCLEFSPTWFDSLPCPVFSSRSRPGWARTTELPKAIIARRRRIAQIRKLFRLCQCFIHCRLLCQVPAFSVLMSQAFPRLVQSLDRGDKVHEAMMARQERNWGMSWGGGTGTR